VAGEFGHMKVKPGGRLCGCGQRGCVEAYAGGRKLIEQMQEAIAAGTAPVLAKIAFGKEPNPAMLEKAVMEGGKGASAIYGQGGDFLAVWLANQITMLNPARVILGGGVLANAPQFRALLEQKTLELALTASRLGLEIRNAALGDDSGLIGAA